MMRSFVSLFLLTGFLVTAGCSCHVASSPQKVIGATATIHVEEAGFDYLARIDTGARTTSIHALNLQIEKASNEKADNVGKSLTFDLFNKQGQAQTLTVEIADVVKVRNAQGVEYRYQVPLTLLWEGEKRKVLVNLRDRSAMTYALLIGRDFLSGTLVDVDRDAGE